MPIKTQAKLTPDAYLAIERQAETKSEFFNGEMFAMADASRRHNLIVTNIMRELSVQLRDRPCDIYANDMRVKVSETGLYTYPDVVVACDDIRFEDDREDTLLNPIVLIEVLSKSTQGYDRFQKLAHYQRLDSLRECLLVSHNQWRIEQYVRQLENQWLLVEWREPGDVARLASIDCELSMVDVYEKLTHPPISDM